MHSHIDKSPSVQKIFVLISSRIVSSFSLIFPGSFSFCVFGHDKTSDVIGVLEAGQSMIQQVGR